LRCGKDESGKGVEQKFAMSLTTTLHHLLLTELPALLWISALRLTRLRASDNVWEWVWITYGRSFESKGGGKAIVEEHNRQCHRTACSTLLIRIVWYFMF
jgi:hypothetical protein